MKGINPVKTLMDTSLVLEPGESEAGNRSNNYVSLIGSLMYATIATRPDIRAFSDFIHQPCDNITVTITMDDGVTWELAHVTLSQG